MGTAGFDASKPNIARVYDFLLGGKDNFEADRQMARELLEHYPVTAQLVRDNRAFLARAVTWAAGRGIAQFLDLGAGLPTQENTHQIAQRINPRARVCYVDNDPVVVLHAKSLLAGPGGVAATQADIASPEVVLADEQVRRAIDLIKPACVIMAAVLHFYPPDEARRIAGGYIGRLAPGSVAVISCAHSDDERHWSQGSEAYRAAGVHNHSREDLRSFFDGMDLVPPGIATAHAWRGDMVTVPGATAGPAYNLAAVGVKP
jgi:hypothetical protein